VQQNARDLQVVLIARVSIKLCIKCDGPIEICIAASPDAGKVDLRIGDAREIVPALEGPFDLVFIDAWKGDYPHYYEAVLPKLADHGLIVCDNVLWGGDVVDPSPDDENGRALAAFNDLVQRDDRVENALLTVGDGLMVIWRAAA